MARFIPPSLALPASFSLLLTLALQIGLVSAPALAGEQAPNNSTCAATPLAEQSTVTYDEKSACWLKYFTQESDGLTRVMCATSTDGASWETLPAAALDQSAAGAWDERIQSLSIMPNPGNSDRKFLLWYVGKSAGKQDSGIGLAYSSDGRKFTRLPSRLSTGNSDGLLLSSREAFGSQHNIATCMLDEPRVLKSGNHFQMWYSKMGLDAQGNVVTAGIGQAYSSDGLIWSSLASDALTLQFDRSRVSPKYIANKLHHISSAYCDTAM